MPQSRLQRECGTKSRGVLMLRVTGRGRKMSYGKTTGTGSDLSKAYQGVRERCAWRGCVIGGLQGDGVGRPCEEWRQGVSKRLSIPAQQLTQTRLMVARWRRHVGSLRAAAAGFTLGLSGPRAQVPVSPVEQLDPGAGVCGNSAQTHRIFPSPTAFVLGRLAHAPQLLIHSAFYFGTALVSHTSRQWAKT